MEILKATSSDSEALLEFFNSTTLPGYVELSLDRREPFDALYAIQSQDYDTFIIRDRNGRIHGTFSIIYSDSLFNDKLTKIGFATDIRVGSNREALLTWSRYFLETIDFSRKQRNCEYLFSVLSQGSGKTYNTFLRGRSRISTFPRYHLIRRFVLITVNGRVRFFSRPLSTIRVARADHRSIDALINYFALKVSKLPLAPPFIGNAEKSTKDFFMQRLTLWKGLKLEDFLIAYDSQNNIVGCMAPWDPTPIQSYKVQSYHGSISGYRKFFAMGSLIGMTRRLPSRSNNLRFKFLTHVCANNHDIFQALLYRAYNNCTNHEFLVYSNFDGDLTTWLPKNFIGWSMPFGLYSLGPEPLEDKSLLPSPLLPPPYLEAALI